MSFMDMDTSCVLHAESRCSKEREEEAPSSEDAVSLCKNYMAHPPIRKPVLEPDAGEADALRDSPDTVLDGLTTGPARCGDGTNDVSGGAIDGLHRDGQAVRAEPVKPAEPSKVAETSKVEGCWSCKLHSSKCATCVFNDVKAGRAVDKAILVDAVLMYERMLGFYSMSLTKKNTEMMAHFNFVLNLSQKMALNLDMLRRITDNELNYVGTQNTKAVMALLNTYVVNFNTMLQSLLQLRNVTINSMNSRYIQF